MTWDEIDWQVLDRLRMGFLSGQTSKRSYWKSEKDLANYDFTFAARIGWKWDAVLGALRARPWQPPPGPLLDWGCGSGVACRRVLAAFGPTSFSEVRCFDRSRLAVDYSLAALQRDFPNIRVAPAESDGTLVDNLRQGVGCFTAEGDDRESCGIGTLVVSHVLNELPEFERKRLLRLARQAQSIVWVEPGTHADSHSLIAVREALRDDFRAVAPCSHSGVCGLATMGKTPHWCHFFAPPPAGIHADSGWVRFAQRAGIDLRSLPYSYLVLDRRQPGQPRVDEGTDSRLFRLLGLPRRYKGFLRMFACGIGGVKEYNLQERTDRALFKELLDEPPSRLIRMLSEGDRVESARWLGAPQPVDGDRS